MISPSQLTTWSAAVFEKTCATTQKTRKKSCFFIFKKRKKRKKRTYSFNGCLMLIVLLHCCQNLTLPNVPTRCLLPGIRATAASATVWGLNGRRQDHGLWPQSDGFVYSCEFSLVAFAICCDSAQPELFSNGSEWIALADLGTELRWSLSEVCELISMDSGLNFC